MFPHLLPIQCFVINDLENLSWYLGPYVCVLSNGQLFATPWTVVCQAPLSVEFSRQGIREWVAISRQGILEWVAISFFT